MAQDIMPISLTEKRCISEGEADYISRLKGAYFWLSAVRA